MPLEPNPAPPDPGSTLVGSRLLEEWVRAQTDRPTVVCARLSAECGLRGHQPAMGWYGKNPKRPSPPHWPVIERLTGIAQTAWETWEKLGHDEPVAPPESGSREVVLPDLGSTPDEISGSIRRLKAVIAKGNLSGNQHAAIERAILSGLGDLTDLARFAKLEDHPEYLSHIDAIADAFGETLKAHGIAAKTLRMEFVDRYEANLETARKKAA